MSLSCLTAGPIYGATASATATTEMQFNIPAGSLVEALTRFGRQSGIQVSVNGDLARGVKSGGVSGRMAAEAALGRLLAGTGLAARYSGAKNVLIQKVSSTIMLGPVRVQGQAETNAPRQAMIDNLPPPYAGGQIATGANLGMLGNRKMMDTPFSTTSYTSDTIRNQQSLSLAGVLNNDPSVRSIWPQGSYTDLFYIRGFQVLATDIALDGLYGVLPAQLVTTDFLERVDILRGPGALLNGISPSGAIGGTVNVTAKRAADQPLTRLDLRYSSNLEFGGHADVSRRFGKNNEWGLRLNASYQGGNGSIDREVHRLGDIFLGADYRGSRLRASIDVGYQHQFFQGSNQPTYITTGGKIPKAPSGSSSYFAPWSYWNSGDVFGVVRAEYDIMRNLTAFASGGFRNNTTSTLATQPTIQNSAGDISANPYILAGRSDGRSGVGGIRGNWQTGPIHHDFSVIGTGYFQEGGSSLAFDSTPINTNMYNPTWGAAPSFPTFTGARPRTSTTQFWGAAVADTLSALDNRIQVTLGVRRQQVMTRTFNASTQAVTSSYDKGAWTPAFAAVVKPVKNLSLYFNYIEGLQSGSTAPSTAVNYGEVLAPFKSRQYEFGAKYDFGRVLFTFSAYQITEPNAYTNPTTLIYSADGSQRNRGVEISAVGKITDNLRIMGGISKIDARLRKVSVAADDGNKAPGVPDVQLNMGVEWDMPYVPDFTLTSKVIYTSSQYADNGNDAKIPNWTRWDIGARYTWKNNGWKAITFRADVRNLLGKNYWAESSAIYGLSRGEPRTGLFSVSVDF